MEREELTSKGYLEGKSVVLWGLGLQNLAIAPYLYKKGANLRIVDHLPSASLKEKLSKLSSLKYQAFLGKHWQKGLEGAEVVFVSPGVPTSRPAFQKLKQKALILEPIELLLRETRATSILVTGTKGKSTVSALIQHLLLAGGKEAYLAGNIGAFEFERLINLPRKAYIVLEVSSFQLERMRISGKIAVVLDVTEDHLAPLSSSNPNFHPSLRAYRAAKKRLLEYQTSADYAVISADTKLTRNWARTAKAKVIYFSKRAITLKPAVFVKDNFFVKKDSSRISQIASVQASPLLGKHNLANVCAAIAVAKILRIPNKTIELALKSFQALPHRLQEVAEIKGVRYVDDSLGTNPYTCISAVESFYAPIWLILGGSSKKANFQPLISVFKRAKIKGIALIGEEGSRLKELFTKANLDIPIYFAGTLERAVNFCKKMAKAGDVVLLSPACASLDQFRSAYERGEVFKKLVLNR